MYTNRYYRAWVSNERLCRFRLLLHESDIEVAADYDLTDKACRALFDIRKDIEGYIAGHPQFTGAMSPVAPDNSAPPVVRKMIAASRAWNVGPMAAVAGAIAESVGERISRFTDTLIVENGGDIYVNAGRSVNITLYAGEESPFTGLLGFTVDAPNGFGICTSSGTVGHSFSGGRANAVTVVAENSALADAAATSIANRIRFPDDVTRELKNFAGGKGLSGIFACCGERFAAWGINVCRTDPGRDVNYDRQKCDA